MGAYRLSFWAVLGILLIGCKRPGAAARVVTADAAVPALTLSDVWVSGEFARDLPRFRQGETLVVGFALRARDAVGALRAHVRVVTTAGLELADVEARADVPDGGGRALSQLELTLPAEAAPGMATLTLEVSDQAGQVGRAELPLVVVPPHRADILATGALAGAELVDAHLRPVGLGLPGQLLALKLAAPLPAGTRVELLFLVTPPDGTEPTAPMGPPVIRGALPGPGPAQPDLSFQLPTSVSSLYALSARALDRAGKVVGTARVRFSGDVPDDERDHLSALRLTRLTLRGGPGQRAVRAGLLTAGETLAVSARVAGYKVAGRHTDGGAAFAVGLTLAVRLRDHAGQLVDEHERLVVREGPVVTAPSRMVLEGTYVVPATARGRMMLEVEIEDVLTGTVSSVFREIEVQAP